MVHYHDTQIAYTCLKSILLLNESNQEFCIVLAVHFCILICIIIDTSTADLSFNIL